MSKTLTAILSVFLLAWPSFAFACSVCYGGAASPMITGAKWAVIALLLIVAAVLVGFAAFFINLRKRAKLYQDL
jgi:hypothetical protein